MLKIDPSDYVKSVKNLLIFNFVSVIVRIAYMYIGVKKANFNHRNYNTSPFRPLQTGSRLQVSNLLHKI